MTGTAASTGGWGRRRLLATVGGALAAAALVVVGLGYGIYGAVTSPASGRPAVSPATGVPGVDTTAHGPAHRDAVAAAAMLTVRPEDARRGIPAATPLPTFAVPPATRVGPARVPTGFPHTPEGAVGQLAAIETSVLEAMSIPYAAAVYAEWALPGGVGAPAWELTANVQAFLGSRAGAQDMAGAVAVTVIPAAGLVKGTDGADWVLACVLLDVRAVAVGRGRIGYGHCERMLWADDRWLIGPGPAPARAPSTWPGTDLARAAGWRTWTPTGQE